MLAFWTAVVSIKSSRSCAICSRPARRSCGYCCRLAKGFNALRLVLHDVEDGIQLCNLHHIVDLVRQIEQFQFSILLPHTRERTDQRTQTRAVDVIDIAKIEQYLSLSLV